MSGDQSQEIEVWNKVLRAALAIPGARVDREAYLKKELSKRFAPEIVATAIETTPARAGVPAAAIRSIARSSVAWHRTGVTALSIAAGLPGGWWMAGTLPADLTQFFWHVVVILQKLAYLHGWPQLFDDGAEPDDETLLLFTLFIGVMLGAEGAGKLLTQLGEKLGEQVVKRLPQKALTKWGLYKLVQSIAKWLGVKLTKEGFARMIAKAIPVVSGFISGAITWTSFSKMSKRLTSHLETLHVHGNLVPTREPLTT